MICVLSLFALHQPQGNRGLSPLESRSSVLSHISQCWAKGTQRSVRVQRRTALQQKSFVCCTNHVTTWFKQETSAIMPLLRCPRLNWVPLCSHTTYKSCSNCSNSPLTLFCEQRKNFTDCMVNFFINTCAFTLHELTENKHFEPGGGGTHLDPSARETEAGRSAETVPGQPGLHKKPCFEKQNNTK